MKKVDLDFMKLMEEKYEAFLVKPEERDAVDSVISTGSLALDVSTGIGGIPRGRFSIVYGPESSGKTTLALSIAKQANLKGLKTLYIDPENGLDYDYVEALVGTIDPKDLVIVQPETAEQSFDIAEAGIKSKEFGLIIFDSVGALAAKKVKDGEFDDAHVALIAREIGQFLDRNAYQIRKSNIAFLFVNQVRAKIGPYGGGYETPGGYKLKHDSSLTIFLSKGDEIKQGTESIGVLSKFIIKKNKLARPLKTGFIYIIWGMGIDILRDVVNFAELVGTLSKGGPFYKFEGETLGKGLLETMEFLDKNPETLDKIKKLCYSKVVKVEEDLGD